MNVFRHLVCTYNFSHKVGMLCIKYKIRKRGSLASFIASEFSVFGLYQLHGTRTFFTVASILFVLRY